MATPQTARDQDPAEKPTFGGAHSRLTAIERHEVVRWQKRSADSLVREFLSTLWDSRGQGCTRSVPRHAADETIAGSFSGRLARFFRLQGQQITETQSKRADCFQSGRAGTEANLGQRSGS